MVDSDGRLRIFLPEVRDAGIAAVIFRNSLTKAIIAPFFDKNTSYSSAGNTLPIGIHSLIVLYTDGKYLVADSVPMRPYHHYVIDFTTALWHEADSSSFIWLNTYEWDADRYETSQPKERRPDKIYQVYANQTGNVTGSVYDENNDPLPGVVVMIKGTQTGTITDINGHFALQIDDYSADLVVSFIGYREEELQVTRGSEVRITLQAEVMMLQEVVVVGYSTKLKRELTSSVSMIQGKVSGVAVTREENANQVIPDDIPGDSEKEDAEKQLYEELLTLKTIRSNFSDVGFWEPKLYTDNHGESGFTIKFPDDITRWDAVVYAMNRRLQTGTLRKSIRSYKPLMSQLSMPAFLTRGDSAIFTGKVLNYTHDTVIKGSSVYTAAGSRLVKDISFHQYCSERLPFYAECTDSAKISYVFTRDDGYMDGEERTIPVQEQGILRAEGSLEILKNGDTLNIKAAAEDKVIVELLDSQLDIYMEAARGLVNYRYLCNEQLASRLIGLINYKRIMQFEGKPFRFESDINTILTRLLRNQNEEFLWSWWDNTGNTSYWMSAHILRALRYAGDAGYQVNLDIPNIARKAEYKFEFLKAYSITDIDLLQALAVWDAKLNYKKYLQVFDTIVCHRQYGQFQESLLREMFLLQEIRQMKGLG
ncbi:MAG TPA: carboxypeptidase-like regulatory domain-containing protein, partial [Bacteroidales bacterium]|nr:carboxypeptidase-like regulatory domain-containing protein [Bacteroidales bacterium]